MQCHLGVLLSFRNRLCPLSVSKLFCILTMWKWMQTECICVQICAIFMPNLWHFKIADADDNYMLLSCPNFMLKFDPKITGDCEHVLNNLSACISNISSWMISSKLQLNQDKTEFFVISTSRVLSKLCDIELTQGDIGMKPFVSIKNLGIVFDNTLNMSCHI